MLKLLIGSRRYSSWSLRGWLAAEQSGLPFTTEMVGLYEPDWPERRRQPDLAVAGGKVPVLWGGETASWNALGIIDHLDRLSGGTRFWPTEPAARAWSVSAAAEMQASFAALRSACPMNVMRRYRGFALPEAARADADRIDALWSAGLARFGGPWLAGEKWGAVDILYAPVASRFETYDVALSLEADAYRDRAMAHPLVARWVAAAAEEVVLQPAYEF
jgi:glutathione S-transferase